MGNSAVDYDLYIISETDKELVEKLFSKFVSLGNNVVAIKATTTYLNSAFSNRNVLHTVYVQYIGPGLR